MNSQQSIARALHFLEQTQLQDGSFEGFSSPTKTPFRPAFTYRTTFIAAQILAALSDTNDNQTATIRSKLAVFLLGQKNAEWSFNYWLRGSPESNQFPYPDDLDDTFCALSALWLHDSTLIDETALARMAKLLIACEQQPGGPYKTWLTSSDKPVWQDIDLAANTNVLYFLSLVASPLPNLLELTEKAIIEKALNSPYYPDIFPIAYFIGRSYTGPLRNNFAQWLKDQPQTTPLQTALLITTLARLGATIPTQMVDALLKSQRPNGSWPAAAFCIDPKRNNTVHYHGAAALTTAFAIEALRQTQVQPILPRRVKQNLQPALFTTVTNLAERELRALDADLRDAALTMLHAVMGSNYSQEIILLPQLMQESLKHSAPLPAQTISQLALANLYGWMAYTIYDDFLDGEGEPTLISVANSSLRRSLGAFAAALPDALRFQKFVQLAFDGMDAANAWEVAHCRCRTTKNTLCIEQLPRYRGTLHLADRSLGHTLTPLGILAANNAAAHQLTVIQLAMRHYIAAKQLNDDVHDWREDLCAGRLTYVVTHLLRGLRCQRGTYNLELLLPRAERYFWRSTLPAICKKITHHIARSRNILRQSGIIKTNSPLETLLDRIDQSVVETQKSMHQAEKFLQAYKN